MQVTFAMEQDGAESQMMLPCTAMTFNTEGSPVQLLLQPLPAGQRETAPTPAVQVICHAEAGIEVLQVEGKSALGQGSVPTYASLLQVVQFDGHVEFTG